MTRDCLLRAGRVSTLVIGCSTAIAILVHKWRPCALTSPKYYLALGYWFVVLILVACVSLLMVTARHPPKLAKRGIAVAMALTVGLVLTTWLLAPSKLNGDSIDQDLWPATDQDSYATRSLFDDAYCRVRASLLCLSRDRTEELMGMFGEPDRNFQLLGVTWRLEASNRFENAFFGCQHVHVTTIENGKTAQKFLDNYQLSELVTGNASTSAAVDPWCGEYLLVASGVTKATAVEAPSHLAPSSAFEDVFEAVLTERRAQRQSNVNYQHLLAIGCAWLVLMAWSWCRLRFPIEDVEPASPLNQDDEQPDYVCEELKPELLAESVAAVAEESVDRRCLKVSQDDEFHFVQCGDDSEAASRESERAN